MKYDTRPNDIYVSRAATRGGRVEKVCWIQAINQAKQATTDLQGFLDAIRQFNRPVTRREGDVLVPGLSGMEKRAWNAVRKRYWYLRVGMSGTGEFNEFNRKWTDRTEGRPPIGPDGLWMELEHAIERSNDVRFTFDPGNILEAFHRQHTLRTPQVAFRWKPGSFEARSPHDPSSWIQGELKRKVHLRACGDPLDFDQWP